MKLLARGERDALQFHAAHLAAFGEHGRDARAAHEVHGVILQFAALHGRERQLVPLLQRDHLDAGGAAGERRGGAVAGDGAAADHDDAAGRRVARGIGQVGVAGDGQRLALEFLGRPVEIELPLIGRFQAWNALCALGLVLAADPAGEVGPAVEALESLEGVPGRLQLVAHHPGGAPVIVDYAHTPDALETVLTALRPHAPGRLVVVFGCGGDRDRGKRPVMGEIACRLADRVIVTDDNPRSEVPEAIRKGTEQAKKSMFLVPLVKGTIPHDALGHYGAGEVLLRPAGRGTGVIAGGPVRAVLEQAGVKDVVTKCIGSNNPHNVVRATVAALLQLRTLEQVSARRGKPTEAIRG